MQIAALRRVEKHKGGSAERKACVNTSSWFKQYHGGGSGTSMKYGVENPLRLLLENPDAGKVRQTAFFAPVSGGGKNDCFNPHTRVHCSRGSGWV